MQGDLLQGAHQAGGALQGPELRGGLQQAELQVEGGGMVPAVVAAERDEALQVPGGDHRGWLFKHDFRHEVQISALFLRTEPEFTKTGALGEKLLTLLLTLVMLIEPHYTEPELVSSSTNTLIKSYSRTNTLIQIYSRTDLLIQYS